MNACRILWWVLAIPTGLVGFAGAIYSASVAWVLVIFVLMALALGTLSANLQSLDREGRVRGRISRSTVVAHGCLAGAVVVAMFGLSGLIGTAVLPLAVLMGVTSPSALAWWRARRRLPTTRASLENSAERRAAPRDDLGETTSQVVEAMTDRQLCLAWRRSYVELGHSDSAETRASIAGFRGRVLDELERRNPVGFDDWLASGARAPSDPARYLLRSESREKRL
ncbi:hypothetical protein [Kribbella speibonae]|uniref:Uncharacterized protein n=1 Tax=Kribbella speibonae TaxID=1572660 RepID=A0ABY2AC79_9ACTN|nr:hypothetical protein [Kribbella speibonae]TCC26870.1 hypothetical protein E0H58_02340 [Kribbella speibonae]